MTLHATEEIESKNMPHGKETPKTPESQSARVVFPEGVPKNVSTLSNAMGPVRAKLGTLHDLQTLNPTEERAKEMIDLERKRGRIARFAMLKKWATPEQEKILDKKDTLENLRASDFLLLKKKWVDLTNLLLVPVNVDPTKSTNRTFIESGDHKNFIVNFGESKSLDHVIGAGDILPPTVAKIKINGVEGERKIPPTVRRPGYYTKKGEYLDIHDGNKLEVVKIGTVDEKGIAESSIADDVWLRERRIEDMIDNRWKALSVLPDDEKLEKEAQEEIKRRKELWADFSPEDALDNKENLKWDALWNNEKFQQKLTQICTNLWVKKEDMELVMRAESKINPKIVNSRSGATGLIQFMPKTAIWLGTTVWALRKMTSIEQLNYVERYFKPYAGKLHNAKDLYMVTFYPVALWKSGDFILWSQQGSGVSPEMIAEQNQVIALGKSVITVADFHNYVDRKHRDIA